MDSTAIAIAVIGTLLFVGVLLWKAAWLWRKVNEPPPGEGGATVGGVGREASDDREGSDDR